MNATTIAPTDWISQLRKQANAQEAPRDEVAEAFASQAYTTIENRSGLLMTDPHLLGFEIIERNENNNRLLGAFAFRVGETLLLAPVFFLNGTLKGQYLLYNKTKDQFIPNNKTQIKAIMAEARDASEGEPIDRNATQGATMEFDTQALAAPPNHKYASAIDVMDVTPEANKQLIRDLWKSAAAAAMNMDSIETQPLLKQFLVDHPDFKEKAASLIRDDEGFAEAVVISGALRHDTIDKQASAPEEPKLRLLTELPDDHEKFAAASESLFKRGYSLSDSRSPEDLLEAICEGDSKETLRTSPHNAIDYALDHEGNPVKVLVAPVAGRSSGSNELIVLEGKDKGRCTDLDCEPCCDPYEEPRRRKVGPCVFTDDKSVPPDEIDDAIKNVGKDKPAGGKHYRVFFPSLGKFYRGGRIKVKSARKDGDVTVIKTEYGDDIIQRSDLDETAPDDAAGSGHSSTPTFGSDARWIEVKSGYESPCLMDSGKLLDYLVRKNSRGRVTAGKSAGEIYLRHGNRTKTYATEGSMAYKLASLGLNVDDAYEITDRAAAGERLEFDIIPQATKLAHVWYDRQPDHENDFIPTGYDPDFGIVMDDMSGVPQRYPTSRSAQTRPASHYLDAAVPFGGGPAPEDHIPDDVLFGMTNPAQELSEAAQTSGLDHLIDHGALGSLVKTFDAVALASTYLKDLEKGIDRLGRIVFLILWKPHDFSEKFGENDMPHLENTLVAAFEKHGDLVLELRQNASDE